MTLLDTSGTHKVRPDDSAGPRDDRQEVWPTSIRTIHLEQSIGMVINQ